MIDTFTKRQFEDVLELISKEHNLRWDQVRYAGSGEHIYRISMQNGLLMVVHSSVSTYSNMSDGSGENSIRVWVQDPLTKTPVLSKFQNWITRVPGWEQRLEQMIVKFLDITEHIEFCEVCERYERIFTVRKEGANKGRLFKKCECNGSFTWMTDTNGNLLDNIPY